VASAAASVLALFKSYSDDEYFMPKVSNNSAGVRAESQTRGGRLCHHVRRVEFRASLFF